MHYYDGKKGFVEVICGPMFAGKTEELIRRVKRMDYAHKHYQIFKPSIDNRYSISEVVSHNKRSVSSISVAKAIDIIKYLKEDTQAIVIDEVQFFDEEIVNLIKEFIKQGLRVICAGLDKDFRGEPFGIIGQVLAIADEVTKLTAICSVCGEPATMTQRIINGHPASFLDPQILVGEKESYEARCKDCHIVL